MLRCLLLPLQIEREVKPPKCNVASLGMTAHAEFSLMWSRFIQVGLLEKCEKHSASPRASLCTSLVFLKIAACLYNSTMHSNAFFISLLGSPFVGYPIIVVAVVVVVIFLILNILLSQGQAVRMHCKYACKAGPTDLKVLILPNRVSFPLFQFFNFFFLQNI